MPTSPNTTYKMLRVDPVNDPEDSSAMAVNLKASLVYPAGTVLGELIGTDEVQTITIDAAGGTFTITFGAQTTVALAWNATAAVVQAALEALSTIGIGNILVTKSGLVYTLVFRGALGSQNVAAVTTTATSLTGGANTAVVATTTAGVLGTPGVYGPYASGNTDGSQNPKGILKYAVATDAAGLIWQGGVAGVSEWGQSTKDTPMWVSGNFRTEDCVGLDTNAIGKLGRLLYGTYAKGAFAMFGS
jgi:hypothetical protein